MSLSRQLTRWTKAQIIDQATADQILAFERSNSPRSLGAWVVGLGILGVGMGIIALVASNWEGIPGLFKILVDLGLLAALGYAVRYYHPRAEHRLTSEVCVGVLYFLTLASLALVGQVYQLEGPLYRTWAVWLFSTLSLMLHARSWFLIFVWAGTWALGYLLGVTPIAEARSSDQVFLPLTYIFAGPLVFDAAGTLPWKTLPQSKHAQALRSVSVVATALGAFASTFGLYETGFDVPPDQYWLAFGCTLGITVLAVVWGLRTWGAQLRLGDWARSALWVSAWVHLVLAPVLPEESAGQSLAALMQFWVLALCIAWSYGCGSAFWVRFCVIAAALRIVVAYVEVFGTLLDTGLALLGGGLLVLALSFVWRRWVGKWIPKESRHE